MKPIPTRSNALVVLLALLASAVSASAGVLVVDKVGGPGANYTEIQAAVNAAGDGDTILARDGTYAPFTITGKSLGVVADGANVIVEASPQFSTFCIFVRNLPGDGEVLIRGLRTNFGVAVTDCNGSVWLDEIECTGGLGDCSSGGAPGGNVTGSARVTFTRCTFQGETGSGAAYPSTPSEGFRATASTVQLLDCAMRGGFGGSVPEWPIPQLGAVGLRLEASMVTIVGCTIEGGGGGVDYTNLCGGALARGGAGVCFVGAPSMLRSAESTAVGGARSLEPFCPGQAGPQGPAIAGTGTIVALPGFARHLQANSPVRGGETLTFELEAQPGEVPLLLVSLEHEPLPFLNGSLLVGLPPTDVLLLPALPVSGQASLAFPVPNVGAAVASLTFYAQAVFLDPSPAFWLGAGTTVVLLDASF